MNLRAILAGVAAASAAAAAGATPIHYDFSGVGDGYIQSGASQTPFQNAPFMIDVVADTSTLTDDTTDGALLVTISAGSLSGGGGVSSIQVGPGSYFTVPDIAGQDTAGFVTGTAGSLHLVSMFEGAGILGYGGVTNLATTDIVFDTPPAFGISGGSQVYFTNISNATFSATAPEPGTWSMMLIGFAALGALSRGRRKAVAGI